MIAKSLSMKRFECIRRHYILPIFGSSLPNLPAVVFPFPSLHYLTAGRSYCRHRVRSRYIDMICHLWQVMSSLLCKRCTRTDTCTRPLYGNYATFFADSQSKSWNFRGSLILLLEHLHNGAHPNGSASPAVLRWILGLPSRHERLRLPATCPLPARPQLEYQRAHVYRRCQQRAHRVRLRLQQS
jgi:hypothetical protein